MNTLSIFIYLASVISNVTAFVTFISFATIFASVVVLFIRSVSHSENRSIYDKRYHPEKFEAADKFYKDKEWKVHIKHICWAVAVLFVLQLVPSEKVMYTIAASELGEAVATSDVAQELLGEVKETIMFKLDQIKAQETN